MLKQSENPPDISGGKKILTALIVGWFVVGFSSLAFAQNMALNPGFEDWTGGLPDYWYGSKSSISSSNVIQYTTSVHGGSSACQLIRTGSHKRFTTQGISVTDGTEYTIKFWVRGHGDIRTNIWDGAYGTYNSYISVNSADWTQYTQTVTAANTHAAAEFIFSVKSTNSDKDHLQIDDVEILPPSGPPEISNAYTVSSTALDLLYNQDMLAVDPADYTLTGTAAITFSSATIDGTNAKLVHLTGASPNMTGDTILDNIDDSANSTDYDFYAGIMPIANTNTLNPGGTISNDTTATFTGIVSAVGPNKVWISDASGAYNGVLIYDYSFYGIVSRGDSVLIYAIRDEFHNLTELKNPELIVPQTPSTPYPATLINGSDIDTSLTANTNPAEQWEGQLVQIDNAVIVSTAKGDYIATDDDSIKFFRISDEIYSGLTLNIGATYNITGVVHFTYGHYEICPRDVDDIVLVEDNDPPEISSVSAPNDTTVIVTFNEDVEETTAETVSNYTITSRDVTVTNAERDDANHSKVTLTVSGMTEGDYTLTVDNVEDLSGNAMDNVSEPFSYYPPPAIVINEVDADTPGSDTEEFIELYDGGVGNTALDGLVVVLFNGSDDASYLPVADLDGYSTDANGYFVIGNVLVTNVDLVMSNGFLQNGPDAVALFVGNGVDFPNDTPVTTVNLIDAIVYDTNDSDDPGLLVLLNPGQPQVNEDGRGDKDHHSNQRIPNGSGGARNTYTYTQGLPTPGAENEVQAPIPQNVTIQISGDDVVLTWSPGAKTTFNIYRSTDPYAEDWGEAIGSSDVNSYTDYGAASETKYFYYITAE